MSKTDRKVLENLLLQTDRTPCPEPYLTPEKNREIAVYIADVAQKLQAVTDQSSIQELEDAVKQKISGYEDDMQQALLKVVLPHEIKDDSAMVEQLRKLKEASAVFRRKA